MLPLGAWGLEFTFQQPTWKCQASMMVWACSPGTREAETNLGFAGQLFTSWRTSSPWVTLLKVSGLWFWGWHPKLSSRLHLFVHMKTCMNTHYIVRERKLNWKFNKGSRIPENVLQFFCLIYAQKHFQNSSFFFLDTSLQRIRLITYYLLLNYISTQ